MHGACCSAGSGPSRGLRARHVTGCQRQPVRIGPRVRGKGGGNAPHLRRLRTPEALRVAVHSARGFHSLGSVGHTWLSPHLRARDVLPKVTELEGRAAPGAWPAGGEQKQEEARARGTASVTCRSADSCWSDPGPSPRVHC